MSDAAPPPVPIRDRTWPVLCHLAAFAYFVLPALGCIVGPLVVWLARRDLDAEVREHGREALNFNISFLIWHVVCVPFVLILIGYVMLAVVAVTWFVLVIVAAVKASDGVLFRYPFTIRFLDAPRAA